MTATSFEGPSRGGELEGPLGTLPAQLEGGFRALSLYAIKIQLKKLGLSACVKGRAARESTRTAGGSRHFAPA